MIPEALLAEAAQADREADTIFAGIHAARSSAPADRLGYRPLVPAPTLARAERASDLRRKAARLRAEAAAQAPSEIKRTTPALASPPSVAPPSSAAACCDIG
jgi:hypothetical protein